MRLLLKLIPWAVVILCFLFVYNNLNWPFSANEESDVTVSHQTLLESIESLGKMELIRYNFQEITELTEKNSRYLGIFPSGDSKAVLISRGEAVGCIDLTKIIIEDIVLKGDSLLIRLPEPEVCYFKLDMENTRIYAIDRGVYHKDERELIEKAYRTAERQIKESALSAGILEETMTNAELILKPFLEGVSQKKVIFTHQLSQQQIENF